MCVNRVSSIRDRASMVCENRMIFSWVCGSRVSSSKERASMLSANRMSSSGWVSVG